MAEAYRVDRSNGELAAERDFSFVADAAVGGSPSSASERRDRAPIMVSESLPFSASPRDKLFMTRAAVPSVVSIYRAGGIDRFSTNSHRRKRNGAVLGLRTCISRVSRLACTYRRHLIDQTSS